jgi:flagellin
MSLVINSNVSSLSAQRRLNKTTSLLQRSFQRLSSGLRINSAKDDSAGLSISTRFSSQIRGLNQATRNANDGISLLQVAEGALEEVDSALQRIRELSIQASNDTYTSADRSNLQDEVDQLVAEINRINSTTQFNGMNVLNGSFAGKTLQVGAYSGQAISVAIASGVGVSAGAVGASVSIGTQAAANSAIDSIDNAIDSISTVRASLGALQNRFESVVNNLANQAENITEAQSRIQDADIAAETAALTRNSILQQAGTAILAQANQQPAMALSLLG